ncbi:MAG: M24 family metallopeptidase [Ginsengibacter sp.]
MAFEKFGIENHWHKKIVRVGKNTLCIYPENPPDEIIKDDDIVILDFGPVVHGYEAGLGRTYAIGKNTGKLKIKNDVEKAWYETQHWCSKQASLKSTDLFQYVVDKAIEYGYTYGGELRDIL